MTGKIHELAEAINKLPASNRVAYRRSLMEQARSINETINEFQVHVDKYKTKYCNGDGDQPVQDGAGEDGEEEDEEGEYTAEEVRVAEKALNMLTSPTRLLRVA